MKPVFILHQKSSECVSITGLEIFCFRRAIDYISSLSYIDGKCIGMMGVPYGGYFSLYTAAADTRIKSVYAAGFFNDRTKIAFSDWIYDRAAKIFCDAEIAALCAPRRLQIDVGRKDPVFATFSGMSFIFSEYCASAKFYSS